MFGLGSRFGRTPSQGVVLPGSPASLFWRAQNDPLDLFQEAASLGAEVVHLPLTAGFTPYAAIHGSAAREMLVERPDDFPKETRGQRLLRGLLGASVLTTEGDTWKARRRIVQPSFTRAHYGRYATIMQELTDKAIDGWGPTIDLRGELMKLTLSIACETLFSDGLDGEAEIVDAALSDALDAYNFLLAVPFLRIDSRLPFGPPRRWRHAKADLARVVADLLARRRASDHDADDLLGRLLASGLDDDAIASEVVTMLLAGHETTANALCWGLWELARRPALQRQLQAEVADAGPLGMDALRKLPLTKGVWQETLRLHPPVWMLARGVREDTTLGGHPIAKDTTAFLCVHVLHRDPATWQDPEAFDPHRWERGPQGIYLPFGAGHRKCMGERFAAMEAAIVLATVAQRVHLAPTAEPDPKPNLSVTLRPMNAVHVHSRPLAA